MILFFALVKKEAAMKSITNSSYDPRLQNTLERVTNIENSITVIEGDVTIIEGDIVNVDNRVTTIETYNTTFVTPIINSIMEYATTVAFYVNGDALNPVVVSYHVTRILDLVVLTVKSFFAILTACQYVSGGAGSLLPEAFRPLSKSSAPFHPVVGPTINEVDSDIMGSIKVDPLGQIIMWREAFPGTGQWNGPNQGWQNVSISYHVGL
jgi:hypothetical protein